MSALLLNTRPETGRKSATTGSVAITSPFDLDAQTHAAATTDPTSINLPLNDMPPRHVPSNSTPNRRPAAETTSRITSGITSETPSGAKKPHGHADRAGRHVTDTVRLFVAALSSAAMAIAILPAFAVELDGLLIGTVLAFSFAAAAAWNDARSGLIPDELVIAAGATSIATAIITGQLAALGIGAAVVGVPLLMLHVVSPTAMGFGDVKLGLALGGALGLVEPRLGVVALAIAAAGTVVVAGLLGRRSLPFGPALVAGAVVTTVGANPLTELVTGGSSPWR